MARPDDRKLENVPSFADGIPAKEQALIAERPPTLQERAEQLVHHKSFPLVAIVVIGIWILRRR